MTPAVPPGLEPPEVDLRTLLGEMAALKAEIRAETQATRALREDADRRLGRADEEVERARAREVAAQRALEEQRRRTALGWIDLADRIEAALRVAERPAPTGLFRRPDPRVSALADGLRLTLSVLSDRLQGLGARRVDAKGRAFDPATMEAVTTRHAADRPAGEVLEEIAAGYVEAAGVLRAAQVVVNRSLGLASPAGDPQSKREV